MKATTSAEDILYVGPFDFPQRNAAAQLAHATGQALVDGGKRVTIIGRATEQQSVGREFQLDEGLCVRLAADASRPASLAEVRRIAADVRRCLRGRNTQAIIVYNGSSPLLLALLLIGCLSRVPVIGHSTEWYAATFDRAKPVKSVLKWIDTFFRMQILHRATAGLIVSSEYLARVYRRKYTTVVPTLSPVSRQAAARRRSATTQLVYAGIPFEPGIVVTSSRQLKDRLDTALRHLNAAARRGAKFHISIFGITERDYLCAMPGEEPVVRALASRVSFHGRRTAEEIETVVRDADFTILVRDDTRVTRAGFPTKVTESLTLGTPVIISDHGDAPRYVTSRVNGFVLSADHESAIRELTAAIALSPADREILKRECLADKRLIPRQWSKTLVDFVDIASGRSGDE